MEARSPSINLRGVVARVKLNRGSEPGPLCELLWLKRADQMTLRLSDAPVREWTALRSEAEEFDYAAAEAVAAEIGGGAYAVVASRWVAELESVGLPEPAAEATSQAVEAAREEPLRFRTTRPRGELPAWRRRPVSVEEYQDRLEREHLA